MHRFIDVLRRLGDDALLVIARFDMPSFAQEVARRWARDAPPFAFVGVLDTSLPGEYVEMGKLSFAAGVRDSRHR